MKIALIIPSLKKFGPIVFTDYLVQSLINKIDSVEVFYFSSHNEDDVLVDFQCKVTKLSFFKKYDFKCFDIIHSTMFLPDFYVFIHGLNKSNNCVSSMHNYIDVDLKMLHPFYKSNIIIKLWYLALNSFNNFIVSSESMFDYYSEKLPSSSNLKLINYGIPQAIVSERNIQEFDFLTEIKSRYTIVGSCGLLIKRKGFHQLVELLKFNSDIVVVIIGSGPERSSLISLANKLGVLNRLHLLGFKSNYIDYYKYFDIFVMCSYSEGFGLAMLEALSLKIPLVCSELEIYKNVFPSDEVCFFEPDNIQSLVNSISLTMSNIQYFSESSYRLYSNAFTLDVMGNSHRDFYISIL
ncbi:glycosyltransferase family 4 protein [Shewanella sp. SP2S2-4]|uniref:glycosyltransferase family 4 protein n=1 Tax=Shewanella sp. SP2S2-4 TaxID=3063539 RepID=UPI0028925BFC|nr:glycosyltransferase family 4 protein [Shewanella sp. SP2S2-4]MDT3275665.1 glycosyltransferase family 4 protein [Shewanella sp. SP2S2-4]